MNNQLPMFFSSMTPQLPVACARYELRNPKSHLPATGCAKKKKDILNIYVKSQIINRFF